MNCRKILQTLQVLTNELYSNKQEEIQRLTANEKTRSSWIINLRKEEAIKLKKLQEGLTLVENTGFLRLEAYLSLDRKLRYLTQADPCLKGHIVTIGPNQTELTPFFSRVTFNIPITFYKP